mgnify:CR=1 FL=1
MRGKVRAGRREGVWGGVRVWDGGGASGMQGRPDSRLGVRARAERT